MKVDQRVIERVQIPDEDQKLLNIIRAISKEKNMRIITINVESFLGKLMAKLHGIKQYPALVLADKKITGKITKEDLENILKE